MKLNELCDMSRVTRPFIDAIGDRGPLPPRELCEASTSMTLVKLRQDSGIGPLSKLWASLIVFKLVHPRKLNNMLFNLLPSSSTTSRLVHPSNMSSVPPDKELPVNETDLRFERPLKDCICPARPLLFSLKLLNAAIAVAGGNDVSATLFRSTDVTVRIVNTGAGKLPLRGIRSSAKYCNELMLPMDSGSEFCCPGKAPSPQSKSDRSCVKFPMLDGNATTPPRLFGMVTC